MGPSKPPATPPGSLKRDTSKIKNTDTQSNVSPSVDFPTMPKPKEKADTSREEDLSKEVDLLKQDKRRNAFDTLMSAQEDLNQLQQLMMSDQISAEAKAIFRESYKKALLERFDPDLLDVLTPGDKEKLSLMTEKPKKLSDEELKNLLRNINK